MNLRVVQDADVGALNIQVVIDCADPAALAAFWAAALNYIVEPPPPGFDSWEQFAERIGLPPQDGDRLSSVVDPDRTKPRILFQKVPEAKVAKNRVHLDIDVAPGVSRDSDERKAAAKARCAQLTARGARFLRELDEPAGWCLVLADPDASELRRVSIPAGGPPALHHRQGVSRVRRMAGGRPNP